MFTFSRKIAVIIGVIMLGAFARVDSVHCELPPLISREVLFGNPQRTAPRDLAGRKVSRVVATR